MSEAECFVALVLGLCFVGGAWDALRRAIAGKRFNQETLDRIAAQEREIEKLHGQVQAVMGKLNAATAATAGRMPARPLGAVSR